jgi:hypothetical protein
MNTLSFRLLFLVIILSGFFLLTNCGGGAGPTPEERITKLLTSGTWTASAASSSIILEGIEVKGDLFPGLTLRFTPKPQQIIATGTSPVWDATDTWAFKPGSKAMVLIRGSDEREITIVEISSSVFKFTMEWDETTYGGKSTSLPGTYEFTLTK